MHQSWVDCQGIWIKLKGRWQTILPGIVSFSFYVVPARLYRAYFKLQLTRTLSVGIGKAIMHLHIVSSKLSFLLTWQLKQLLIFFHACSSVLQMAFRNKRAQADVALSVNDLEINKRYFCDTGMGDPPLSLCPSSPWPPPYFRLCSFFRSEPQSLVWCPPLQLFLLVALPCHQSPRPHLKHTSNPDQALNSQAASFFLLLSWFSRLSAEKFTSQLKYGWEGQIFSPAWTNGALVLSCYWIPEIVDRTLWYFSWIRLG